MHYITKEKAKTRRNSDKFPLCKINIFLSLFRVIQKLFINKNLTMPYRHTEGAFSAAVPAAVPAICKLSTKPALNKICQSVE